MLQPTLKGTLQEGNKTSCILRCPIYNGHMFREEKNLKDSAIDLGITIKDTSSTPISYNKTDKLITALYMVTDIIDRDEPLRNKLRTLGTEIISDINRMPASACGKISEIMSFLGIARAMNIVSEMNCNILKKEFSELSLSIKEATNKVEVLNRKVDLSSFFTEELFDQKHPAFPSRNQYNSIGHRPSVNVGLQKGSTLLKALSDRTSLMSDRNVKKNIDSFDFLKKQRREDITNFIKKNAGGGTITDIRNGVHGTLASCSEKTLQRELVSMVKDGVLNKTGEKRWSRYFIK